jgi:transposase
LNPFTTPDRILISRRPQDMRAGIDSLSRVVAAEMGMGPADGSLYVFVSRDRRRLKMLRYEGGAWCMWHLRLAGRRVAWEWGAGEAAREVGRRELLWVIEGLASGPEPPAASGSLIVL